MENQKKDTRTREERAAEALRANLRRRKQQQQARTGETGDKPKSDKKETI